MSELIFPDNIIAVLKEKLVEIDGVSAVLDHELAPTTPNGAIGITFEYCRPVDYEIGGRGASVQQYVLHLEHLVKSATRESGNTQHRLVANAIRSMLYHDNNARVALRQLKHVSPAATERMLKWTLEQRFASNKLKDAFYFVSGTTVTFETELA